MNRIDEVLKRVAILDKQFRAGINTYLDDAPEGSRVPTSEEVGIAVSMKYPPKPYLMPPLGEITISPYPLLLATNPNVRDRKVKLKQLQGGS